MQRMHFPHPNIRRTVGSWTWIIRHTFRRLYAFIVMAPLIAVLGIVTIERMPTDILQGSTGPGAPVC